jgi:hypothetical protein
MRSLAKDNNPRFAKKFYLLLTMCLTAGFAIAFGLLMLGLIARHQW